MKDDPPIVRWELVAFELLDFGRVYEGELSSLALGNHSVGDNNILEPVLLANIIILGGELFLAREIQPFSFTTASQLTFGKFMPGNIILEQYASAVGKQKT